MATVTLQGNPVSVAGELPAVGSQAPSFSVTGADLSPVTLASFAGKKLILNIYPSVDTGTCAASTRQFNSKMNERDDVVVLCVSQDLPFAFSRFCGAEGLEQVQTASTFRSPEFLTDYGVKISDGVLAGLCARAVVVLDAQGVVTHTQLVGEIADEPDYAAALAALG
ncbi:MAG: thiol peroxidase [Reinekea forsetii]|jgi:thiol peroxidase|uniref:thiol peroxidase n=1 Tax=Reinekea sp. TaxID=1970455 RepID=UPI00257CFD20|nr:thiol peroxidase [Reinekea sp.]MDO7641869.1 thiol peroxidase [Reinekea forsetii]MDO7645222.1 thiol peroxidase [Reinekea forsetii]MDO7674666.1 thiol peroxidase [Reinekea forsetii]